MFVKDEPREVDRGQLVQSPVNHSHEFGLYLSTMGKSLKGFQVYLSGMINIHLKPIPSGGRVGKRCVECSHLKASGLVKEVLL